MKRAFLSLLSLLFLATFSLAQKKELFVKNSEAGLYLDHKVAPKESFYAIGRIYNVSPKFIASYNKLDLNKGLQIDQKLRIPLTDTNFTQKGNSGTPVYYKVGDNEGLMTVSNKNRNVTLNTLRGWNDLSSDELKKDSKLIVGFLLSKELPSVTIKPKIKTEEAVVKKDDKIVEEKPLVKPEEKTAESVPKLTKDEKKAEEKEAEAELKAEKKEEKKVEEAKEEKKKTEPVVVTEKPTPIGGEGYFKSHYDQQVRVTPVSKNETVTSGIFKTTSGWQDAKYYLLIDKVAPGTIVKVINPTNNKIIYAKVLGEMSGIRQNEGLNIRISNAAASMLEIAEQDKFIVKVNY